MGGGLWAWRQETQVKPVRQILADREPEQTHRKHKPPSKRRHDRERVISHLEGVTQRREERLRLFGYVKLKNGEVISIDEAVKRLRDGVRAREDPTIVGGITREDILEWRQAESFRDVLDSIGEVDALVYYPALGIEPGTVLLDPKISHKDPALLR